MSRLSSNWALASLTGNTSADIRLPCSLSFASADLRSGIATAKYSVNGAKLDSALVFATKIQPSAIGPASLRLRGREGRLDEAANSASVLAAIANSPDTDEEDQNPKVSPI
jgi:hypothetical protein